MKFGDLPIDGWYKLFNNSKEICRNLDDNFSVVYFRNLNPTDQFDADGHIKIQQLPPDATVIPIRDADAREFLRSLNRDSD